MDSSLPVPDDVLKNEDKRDSFRPQQSWAPACPPPSMLMSVVGAHAGGDDGPWRLISL